MKKESKAKILGCNGCGYEGLRWNDNSDCKMCGGLMKIIMVENGKRI